MQNPQGVVILDFGGQYTQLIARRVRESGVYSAVLPYTATAEEVLAQKPKGLILSGGPAGVLDGDAPLCGQEIFELGIPVLGICYDALMAHVLGGSVEKAPQREYGRTPVTMDRRDRGLLKGMAAESPCWMSHTWQVSKLPQGFGATAHTASCPVAAMEDEGRRLYGVQFHPEVTHTQEGRLLLENFLKEICGLAGDWNMEAYADMAIRQIAAQVGDRGTVLLGQHGGVDSAVTAALIYRAIGDRLTCVVCGPRLHAQGRM